MAAPAFLTRFPMYCPHGPALASEKAGRHFPACCSRRSQAMPSYLEGKTRLQDIKETRISSHKQKLRQQPLGGPLRASC